MTSATGAFLVWQRIMLNYTTWFALVCIASKSYEVLVILAWCQDMEHVVHRVVFHTTLQFYESIFQHAAIKSKALPEATCRGSSRVHRAGP